MLFCCCSSLCVLNIVSLPQGLCEVCNIYKEYSYSSQGHFKSMYYLFPDLPPSNVQYLLRTVINKTFQFEQCGFYSQNMVFQPISMQTSPGRVFTTKQTPHIINIRYFESMILGRRLIKLVASSLSGTSQLSMKRSGNRRDSH